MLSCHKDIWRRRLGTIREIYHTIDLKEGRRPICQQSCRAGQRSREKLREPVSEQVEARVIEQA